MVSIALSHVLTSLFDAQISATMDDKIDSVSTTRFTKSVSKGITVSDNTFFAAPVLGCCSNGVRMNSCKIVSYDLEIICVVVEVVSLLTRRSMVLYTMSHSVNAWKPPIRTSFFISFCIIWYKNDSMTSTNSFEMTPR